MSGYKTDDIAGAFAHPEGGTLEFAYTAGTWTAGSDDDALALASLAAAGLAEVTEGGKPKVAKGAARTLAPVETAAPQPAADTTTTEDMEG